MKRTLNLLARSCGVFFLLLASGSSVARAGFFGDTVTVDALAHWGDLDPDVSDYSIFSQQVVTIAAGVELMGDSDPDAPGDSLAWTLDLDDFLITFTATNSSSAAVDLGYVYLHIVDFDQMPIQYVNVLHDDFGFVAGDVQWSESLVDILPLFGYAPVPANGESKVILQLVVPEPSALTLAVMSLLGMAVALATGALRRAN